MCNEFVANGSFIPTMDKKGKSDRKPSEIIIERVNSQGKKMKFRVIDNATRLHPKVSTLRLLVDGQSRYLMSGSSITSPGCTRR